MRLPQVGAVFHARYRLDAILGAGGFATVYKASDSLSDRIVALKVLKPELTGYPAEVRSRFDREVEIVANLRDEHTITLFDFGTSDEGLLFMVTEFVPGEDLSGLLKRRGRLEPPEVIHILLQVLHSLREAHAAGLLHRDIKPANIRVFEYAGDPLCVRVLDFGIAKRMGNDVAGITKDGAILGTPRYMSPEQLLQGELTPASDIYSLGIVAYELLMGTASIHGTQLSDQLERLATGHVFSIPEIDRIGPGLCRLLDRMAARDVERRFHTADEVIGGLNALRRGPGAVGSSDMIPVTSNHTPQHLMPPIGPNHTPDGLRPPPHITPQTGSHEFARRPVPVPTDPAVPIEPGTDRRSVILGVFAAAVLIGLAIVMAVALNSGDAPAESAGPELPKKTVLAENPLVRGKVAAPKTVITPRVVADAGATEATPVVRGSVGCGQRPQFRGFRELRVQTAGLQLRSTYAYIPRDYDPNHPHPLVVMLHENAETPEEFMRYSGMEKTGDEEPAILIAPYGDNPYSWKKKEDNERIVEIAIDDARIELCVDLDRIYIVGHGAGGKVAEEAPCALPSTRAFVTTSHRTQPRERECNVARRVMPIPYLMVAPLKDEYNPVEGGKGCSGNIKISLAEKEAQWREINGCKGPERVWHKAKQGVCYTWDCEAPLVSCHVDGGRNWDEYPGRRLWDTKGCDGPPTHFPYAATIWKFFREFGGD